MLSLPAIEYLQPNRLTIADLQANVLEALLVEMATTAHEDQGEDKSAVFSGFTTGTNSTTFCRTRASMQLVQVELRILSLTHPLKNAHASVLH